MMFRSKRVTLICEDCQQPFERYRSAVKRDGTRFCSMACRYRSHQRIAQTCKGCQQIFYRWPSASNRQFCSRRCVNMARKKEIARSCATCGKSFQVPPNNKKLNNQRFCSLQCAGHPRRTSKVELTCQHCHKPFMVGRWYTKAKYCSRSCRARSQTGARAGGWGGGINRPNTQGYIEVYTGPGRRGRRFQHIVVAERALGRPLPPGAIIHHLNGDRKDNRPSNLVICQDQSYHALLHARTRVLRAGGNPNLHRRCHRCRQVRDLADFHQCADCGISDECFRCSSQPWATKRQEAA